MPEKTTSRIVSTAISASLLLLMLCSPALAVAEYKLSKGQLIYVPVYSNIFSAPRKIPFNLSTLLSIRNTDMNNQITVHTADYYDTKGDLVRRYYQQPVVLGPLETTTVYIPEDDTSGGVGANFIVRWSASKAVNVPIVECVMIGMKSGQGISFVSPGQEIRNTGR